ncbi:MAG: nucleoside-diphosphate kinase [Dehalococcoidales bacterium]
MERSLVLIKPDAMERGLAGVIIGRLQGAGLKLIGLKMLHMDKALAEKHYAIHKGKSFFNDLVEYITSAPIVAAVFEGEGAIERIRTLMGATDPAKAEACTIRKDYGLDIQRNATHASDSPKNGEIEIANFFKKNEIYE